MMRPEFACFIALAVASLPALAEGPAPLNERVLVVYNSNGQDSLAVAKHYMSQRKIPEANRCKISASATDHIDGKEFETKVKPVLQKCVEQLGKQKVLYIVLSFNTPYVIMFGERGFALDQYVADLWDEYAPGQVTPEMRPHPYFAPVQSKAGKYRRYLPFADYRAMQGALHIYSVWRLDAANAALAKSLVDKAIFAETYGLSGKGCFDRIHGPIEKLDDTGTGAGDWDVFRSAEFARRAEFQVIEDDQQAEFGTAPAPLRCHGAALYAGWYSLNHYNDAFTWTPGSIGFHLDSASAQDPRGGSNWSANALMKGITITSGAVSEPYLEGLPHPDQIFLDFFQGAVAGDAVLGGTRWLKWMIINIGDPLYRPFPKGIGKFE